MEDRNENVKDDLSVMKQTMMREKVPEEFFEFHERVNQLMEDQDRLINYHMKVIKVNLSINWKGRCWTSKSRIRNFLKTPKY